MPGSTANESTHCVLVTGVNSGLGFGICCRLIDEFLELRPQSQKLHLIITTRDRKKSDDTLLRLRTHLQKTLRRADQKLHGVSKLLEPRISFQPELVDLTQLHSIQRLAEKLLQQNIHIDVLIHNAGVSGVIDGPDYRKLASQAVTDLVNFVTYPVYSLGRVNYLAAPQLQTPNDVAVDQICEPEPPLGIVFTSNVFGPYMLTHQLMPLLSGGEFSSRVIWVGSVGALPFAFDINDFQCLKTQHPYESSKRLLDILLLTYGLPSTEPWSSQWCSAAVNPETERQKSTQAAPTTVSTILCSKQPLEPFLRPKIYIAHPGVFSSNIVAVPSIIIFCKLLLFLCFRTLVGDHWHTVYPYTAAVSTVWLALASQPMLDAMEAKEGRSKWGSAADRLGQERCERTEVEGWGFGGVPGDASTEGKRRKGTWKGLEITTRERREEFEVLGRECWKEIERLREEWEERLGWL